MMSDPTYDRGIIDANPIWKLAFVLSELGNDSAPLGWGGYVPVARSILTFAPKAAKSIIEETSP